MISHSYVSLNDWNIIYNFNDGVKLGQGGYGEVRSFGNEYAIKKVDPYEGFNEFKAIKVLREIEVKAAQLQLDQAILNNMFQ